MDRQRCSLPVESFNFYAKYINLTFQPPGIYFNNFKFKIPQYTLSSVEPRDCSYHYQYENSYLNHTCVEASFIFDRQFSYYFVQMYLPSILIVLVSFLSFWIPVENVSGRVMLGVTSLLTLATQFTTAQRSLPPVSYMKAMDVWMFFCIVVVFFAMGEFTLAYSFKNLRLGVGSRVRPLLVRPRKVATITVLPGDAEVTKRRIAFGATADSEEQLDQNEGLVNRFLSWLNKGNSSVIDNVSKIIFPTTFGVFNIIYWMYYTRAQK
ncbi:Glycine receptor subunit alphaZ1 [Amphibalanus amphitrite]|uniref:Glycine receptor subunit alphaZ1 n=2 Tax=Amphibalanus amphitrite TaxID=1232801 RepID=A0A6A4X7F0_AMPAM|nr:Glycine receptor subunit alphaZ1 [Amphibalanus amphitrite]